MSEPKLTGRASDFLKIGVATAGRGDLDGLKALLEVKSHWVARVGSHGRTMLWEAAYRGRTEVVQYLLERGADIDAHGCHFTPLLVEVSPLTAAKFKKHITTAELLLAQGAPTDIFNETFLGNTDYVLDALRAEPSLALTEKPQHDSNVKVTALHYAVSTSQLELLEALIDHGANPKPYSMWLTRFSVWRKNADVLERLIAAGLEPEPQYLPRSGVQNDRLNKLLEKHGIKLDPDRAEGGWPPLVFNSRGDRGGNLDRVKSILDDGADVNVRNHKGQSALHCAAKAGFNHIVQLLIDRGADVDAQDDNGCTPLITALQSTIKDKQKLFDVLGTLIGAGADPSLVDRRGKSADQIARRKRDADKWCAVLGLSSSE